MHHVYIPTEQPELNDWTWRAMLRWLLLTYAPIYGEHVEIIGRGI